VSFQESNLRDLSNEKGELGRVADIDMETANREPSRKSHGKESKTSNQLKITLINCSGVLANTMLIKKIISACDCNTQFAILATRSSMARAVTLYPNTDPRTQR